MTLTLYPAIDLKDGACVRLKRGEMDQATVYGEDPAAQARLGRRRVSLGSCGGFERRVCRRPVNQAAVQAILAAVQIPVQLGGGIRDLGGHRGLAGGWCDRVILGSAAAKSPELVRTAAQDFPVASWSH